MVLKLDSVTIEGMPTITKKCFSNKVMILLLISEHLSLSSDCKGHIATHLSCCPLGNFASAIPGGFSTYDTPPWSKLISSKRVMIYIFLALKD